MDRNYPGPCGECCVPIPCSTHLSTVTVIHIVLSGITLCIPFGCLFGGFLKRTLLVSPNGGFTLTGTVGTGWTLSIPHAIREDNYSTGTPPCGTIPASTNYLNLEFNFYCDGGAGGAFLEVGLLSPTGETFSARFIDTIYNGASAINLNTSCVGSIEGAGGTGTISW